MKLPSMAMAGQVLAASTPIRYDLGFDNATRSMTQVACSDGLNGLITRYGWQIQGNIPSYPYIGASYTIPTWNSTWCGQCFEVHYNGITIPMLVIDHADQGLVISQQAMDKLTGNRSAWLGKIDAQVTFAPSPMTCGLSSSVIEELDD